MKLVTRLVLMCCSLLVVTAALASARPAPEVSPLPNAGEPITRVRVGPQSVSSVCDLGVSTGAAWLINYILPPNDAYYTLLDPAACGLCSGNSVIATTAHVMLSFPTVCTIPVTVGIVGATGAPGCYTPDLGNVLVAPTTYNASAPAAGVWDFSFALPPGACVDEPAFLLVEFQTPSGCNTSTLIPRLVTTDGCLACTSWNIYPGGGPDDLCVDIGFPGNPLMWVNADCCAVVPTLPKSWGSLKLSYR
ncbi:MAG: hypothetical protein IT348_10620 [Candidatus Eisenbacteria bacterium]|nr:hypothetical protein [Candidatus Eisenbacteria bacterium]